MQNTKTRALKITLKRILGTDFIARDFEGGVKVSVPNLDVNQMGELWQLYHEREIRDINAKRSGTGITIIVEI